MNGVQWVRRRMNGRGQVQYGQRCLLELLPAPYQALPIFLEPPGLLQEALHGFICICWSLSLLTSTLSGIEELRSSEELWTSIPTSLFYE